MSMPDEPGKTPVRYRWTVGAAILAIAGLLILTASGLCTSVVGIGILSEAALNLSSFPAADFWSLLLTLGTAGGIPMLIGFLMARSGFRMRKRE